MDRRHRGFLPRCHRPLVPRVQLAGAEAVAASPAAAAKVGGRSRSPSRLGRPTIMRPPARARPLDAALDRARRQPAGRQRRRIRSAGGRLAVVSLSRCALEPSHSSGTLSPCAANDLRKSWGAKMMPPATAYGAAPRRRLRLRPVLSLRPRSACSPACGHICRAATRSLATDRFSASIPSCTAMLRSSSGNAIHDVIDLTAESSTADRSTREPSHEPSGYPTPVIGGMRSGSRVLPAPTSHGGCR